MERKPINLNKDWMDGTIYVSTKYTAPDHNVLLVVDYGFEKMVLTREAMTAMRRLIDQTECIEHLILNASDEQKSAFFTGWDQGRADISEGYAGLRVFSRVMIPERKALLRDVIDYYKKEGLWVEEKK